LDEAVPGAPAARSKGGVFEGAGYRSKGLYRASTDCIMFTAQPGSSSVPSAARAIERVIDWVAGR